MTDAFIINDPATGVTLRAVGDPVVDDAVGRYWKLSANLHAQLREAAVDTIQTIADLLARREERYPRLMLRYGGYFDAQYSRPYAVKANGHERDLPEFAGDLADLLEAPAGDLADYLGKLPTDKVEVVEAHEGHPGSWVTKVYFTANPV